MLVTEENYVDVAENVIKKVTIRKSNSSTF